MKTVNVREMKAHWSEIEAQVARGETFEVVNRGKPTVRITAAQPREILVWDNHLETAIPSNGRSSQQTISADRDSRY